MTPDDSFTGVMAGLRQGDETVAEDVFARFAMRLVGLARVHLAPGLLRKFDPEDVAQSVYRSFFLRCRQGEFVAANWGGLWGLLATITVRKCVNKAVYWSAQQRTAVEVACTDRIAGREPTPAEAAVLAETVQQLFAALPSDDRTILEYHLCGLEPAEISRQIGRTDRTVRRALQRISDRLEQLAECSAVPG